MKNKGITLVSLIITIIILLILAGITVGQLIYNGLIENARLAKEKWSNAQNSENPILDSYNNELGKYISGDRDDYKAEYEAIKKEYEEFKKSIAKAIEDAGGEETDYNANAETFDRNIKGIATATTGSQIGTATADKILNGYTAYSGGSIITGNMSDKSDQTVIGSTVEKSGTNGLITIPVNGYYSTSSRFSVPISTLNLQLGNSITSLGSGNRTSSISCSVGDYFLIQTIYGIGSDTFSGGTVIATCTGPELSGIDSMGAIVRATSTRITSDEQFGYIKLGIQ